MERVTMYVSLGVRGALESAYLHRSQEDGEQPLTAWVQLDSGTTVMLKLAEIPQLIAALDEMMERAEFTPADARGTVWSKRFDEAAPVEEPL